MTTAMGLLVTICIFGEAFCYNTCMQYDENRLREICKKNGISYLALFGSYARGDFNEDSDVDLLINYSQTSPVKGLLSHLGVAQEFERVFNKPVDLVERSILEPKLEAYITKDLKTLYEG